jgi:hypothetical protein
MKIETRCLACNAVGGHLFLKCDLAKEVWRRLNLDSMRMALESIAMVRDAVDMILKQKDDQKLMTLQCGSFGAKEI